MKVYLVVAISNNAELVNSELFLYQEPALDRAFVLAKELAQFTPMWLEPFPTEDVLDNGSTRWIFLETNKQFVACYLLEVCQETYIKFGSETSSIPVKGIPQTVPMLAKDRLDKNLPGGFSLDKAVKMDVLFDNPDYVEPTYMLSHPQRTALVQARILAIPNYNFKLPDGTLLNKEECLKQIKEWTLIGQNIVSEECNFLDNVRNDSFDKIDQEKYDNEEESSSSSEDEW